MMNVTQEDANAIGVVWSIVCMIPSAHVALNLWDPDGSAKDIDPDLQIEPSPPLERGASLTLHSLQCQRAASNEC